MWLLENLIYIKNLGNIIDSKDIWIDKIIKEYYRVKPILDNSNSNNFPLDQNFNDLTKLLYDKFLQIALYDCSNVWGNFSLREENSSQCWAYLISNSEGKNGEHNHAYTSMINSVFYLDVPKNNGGIIFYRNFGHKLLTYYPKNNDLVIFPNFLVHNIERPITVNPRISINMEIICDFHNSKIDEFRYLMHL